MLISPVDHVFIMLPLMVEDIFQKCERKHTGEGSIDHVKVYMAMH